MVTIEKILHLLQPRESVQFFCDERQAFVAITGNTINPVRQFRKEIVMDRRALEITLDSDAYVLGKIEAGLVELRETSTADVARPTG